MADKQTLLAVARGYYLEDRSKTQIADDLGLSRFKVARLLEQAKAEGIVRISILDGLIRDDALSTRLSEHLALEQVMVVAGAANDATNREALAQATAAHVRQLVQPGWTLGFSWGRTLAAIGSYMGRLPPCTVTALTGTVGTDFEQSPVEVLRGVAGQSEVRTMSMFAPLFADSPATAAGLRRDPAISSVLKSYRALDLAVVSVGSWAPPITQVRDSLTASERADLDRAGVRAEVVGIFISDDGSVHDSPANARRVAITADELRHVPRVLAVAGGADKVPALAAVARSRIITSLVTDERTAHLLLEEASVTTARPASRT